MMSVDILRAAASAGVLAGAVWLITGGTPGLESLAKAAAVQAASVVASDSLHAAVSMPVSPLSDATVVGGMYAAAQYWGMNDRANWMKNFGVSAVSQFVATYATDMVKAQDPVANALPL